MNPSTSSGLKKVFIKTFGCAQNTADSERIKAFYWDKGFEETDNWKEADEVVINTCVVRETAENRVYGLINNINKYNPEIKIIVTGCLVGVYDKKGKINQLEKRIPAVNKFLPIEDVSFEWQPLRDKKKAALIPISSGCNNFCSYCIVPFARGKEISRPMEEILVEVDKAIENGFNEIVLVGQNVNSYGADLSLSDDRYQMSDKAEVRMGKKRFRSMFHILLQEVAKKKLTKISFVSSNPWDFSDELIDVIAKNPNIDRLIHLPFQSGDDEILKKMNRGYTKKEYLDLINKIKEEVDGVKFSTDIIIGFPGETEEAFLNTVDVCRKVGFDIAYINKYSPRRGTVSAKMYENDVPMSEKRKRWKILDDLVNKKLS